MDGLVGESVGFWRFFVGFLGVLVTVRDVSPSLAPSGKSWMPVMLLPDGDRGGEAGHARAFCADPCVFADESSRDVAFVGLG